MKKKKDWIIWGIAGVSLFIALILGNMMHADDSFVETYLFPVAGEGSAVFFWIFLIFTFIGIRIFFIRGFLKILSVGTEKPTIQTDNVEVIEEVTNEEKLEKYKDKCKKIYNKCVIEGYDINDDFVNKIISSSYNLTKEEVIDMYNKGKEFFEEEEKAKVKRVIEEKRVEENKINEENKEKIKLYGKEKYLNVLNERLEGFEAIKKLSKIMSDSYVSGAAQARNVHQTDPYIFGGMANGIAGPAAGIMTANRIQAENEKRKIEGEIIAKNSLDSAVRWAGEERKAGSVVVGLEKIINCINESLMMNDMNDLNNKIKFTDIAYEVLKTNNFFVSIKYSLYDLKIINKEGILDGNFKVNVLDELENVVATGYFSGGNIDFTEGNKVITINMGLNNLSEFKVICISNSEIDSNKKYHVVIEPIHLWMIEKNW